MPKHNLSVLITVTELLEAIEIDFFADVRLEYHGIAPNAYAVLHKESEPRGEN